MAIPAWLEGAASGFGYAPGSRAQEDLLTDPRRAIPEGRRRRMGAFPALSDWQAETAQREANVTGMDPSLPNVPTMDFDTFSGRPAGTAMDEDMPVRSVGASLPRLPDASSFPTEYEDDPRAVAHNLRIRELTVPGRLYSPAEQDAIQKQALGSVDEELGGKMLQRTAAFKNQQELEAAREAGRDRVAETRAKAMRYGVDTRAKTAANLLDFRKNAEAFAEEMGIHKEQWKETVDRISADQKARGLTIQEVAEENKAIAEGMKQAKERGEQNTLFAKIRTAVGLQPGVQAEQQSVPRPILGMPGGTNTGMASPAMPTPRVGATQIRPAGAGASDVPPDAVPLYQHETAPDAGGELPTSEAAGAGFAQPAGKGPHIGGTNYQAAASVLARAGFKKTPQQMHEIHLAAQNGDRKALYYWNLSQKGGN